MRVRYMLEVILPNSANTREEDYVEQALYGHSEVVASADVYYDLVPNNNGGYTHNWKKGPTITYKATTFYQDQDGDDYEREVELTDEEDAFVKTELAKQIRQLEKPIIYLPPRAV